MWTSNEAAKMAANGTHTASRIDNLQFGEGSSETSRLGMMVKGLSEIGFEAQKSDIHGGLMPDQGKRIRYNAIAIAAPTERIPPRLLAILDGSTARPSRCQSIVWHHADMTWRVTSPTM